MSTPHCFTRVCWRWIKFYSLKCGSRKLILTGSAFVPDNEVFAASRALVGPEDAAVDEDLTASSVLALVQHFLGHKE